MCKPVGVMRKAFELRKSVRMVCSFFVVMCCFCSKKVIGHRYHRVGILFDFHDTLK
jgi:hypothetical protein